jgi:hypothetical protein
MHFQANLTFEMQFQKQKTNCVGEKGTAEPWLFPLKTTNWHNHHVAYQPQDITGGPFSP